MEEQTKSLPGRQYLMQLLQNLRDYSAYNESLTRKITGGQEPLEEVRSNIESCVEEQAKIVDLFLTLSDDGAAVARFKDSVREIEILTEKLDKATLADEVFKLREEILHAIESWTASLEKIITGVILRAPEG
jgi:hypothetical protein